MLQILNIWCPHYSKLLDPSPAPIYSHDIILFHGLITIFEMLIQSSIEGYILQRITFSLTLTLIILIKNQISIKNIFLYHFVLISLLSF